MKWNDINSLADLEALPRNRNNVRYSREVLVIKYWTESHDYDTFYMYYDYEESKFYFPLYDSNWKKQVSLKPITDICKWAEIPNPYQPKEWAYKTIVN